MAPRKFPNNLTVISPCTADWEAMIGNDQVRFCEHCSLKVHNLSLLTRNQAERLVARSNGRLCVRYHHDSAGHMLTLPEQQRLHRIGRRVSRIAAGAFTATLSVTSAVAQHSTSPHSANSETTAAAQLDTRVVLSSSIVGTITDQNGAVIPGATISISNDELRVASYVSTGMDGKFRVDSLQAGVYTLRIEAPGFAADETGAYVQANGETRVDRTLSVATVGETVEVDGTRQVVTMGSVAVVAPKDPFVRAAYDDDLEAFTALIAGNDVNRRDKLTHTTALEHAVKNSNREMVQLLLSAGANVNAKNAGGVTVLMMLNDDATSDLVWDLLNARAQVNARDNSGGTALMQVAASNNVEALKALLDGGADVNAKNEEGRTALMLAAAEGLVNNVRTLVLAGADLNVKDEDARDALAHAAEDGHAAVLRFLKSKGAVETVAKVEKEE